MPILIQVAGHGRYYSSYQALKLGEFELINWKGGRLLFFLSGIETRIGQGAGGSGPWLLFFLSGIETRDGYEYQGIGGNRYYSSYQALKLLVGRILDEGVIRYYSSYQALKPALLI